MSDFDDEEEPSQKIRSKRVFMNNVDTFMGNILSKHLAESAVGATLEDLPEEEEEGEDDEQSLKPDVHKKTGMYRIIGTLKDKSLPPPSHLADYCDDKEEPLEKLLESDIIIYNITEDTDSVDEAVWAISSLHAEIDNFDNPKMFILISTVLTWANSKPLDPEDPEIPFTEDDYRRRRSHSNYKDHISAEKLVTKYGKTNKQKLQTYVIASGITYGMGENYFHYLFKQAWLGHSAALPCFGQGNNVIPTLHIKDLASIVQNVMDSKPKSRYIVAVDDSMNTLQEIVKCISKHLGTGKVQNIPAEDALLIKELKQHEFDSLLIDLRMEGMLIKESMNIPWTAETGFVDYISKISREYKKTRKLLPMRICILGPPASGKSTIAKLISEKYKLHHIHLKQVINDTINRLEESAAKVEKFANGEIEANEEENGEDEESSLQEDIELLDQVNESKKDNGGRIEDSILIRFVRDTLKSMKCQNQGFVLDGFPKTYEQAKELFAAGDEEESEDSRNTKFDQTIMPEIVLSLQASDEQLKNRVMNLPEEIIQGTHNTEEEFLRRLQEFRTINVDDESVLNYFDELEIHPENITISDKDTESYPRIITHVNHLMGEPRNYGPTPEEKLEADRLEVAEKMKKEAEEREVRQQKQSEELAILRERQKQWRERLDEIKQQERELLEEQSLPLRNFLMKHVMPTLTSGLIEVCKIRPEDPVDYLAEYLFKNNPDVE